MLPNESGLLLTLPNESGLLLTLPKESGLRFIVFSYIVRGVCSLSTCDHQPQVLFLFPTLITLQHAAFRSAYKTLRF
jgi:hypothetical protein